MPPSRVPEWFQGDKLGCIVERSSFACNLGSGVKEMTKMNVRAGAAVSAFVLSSLLGGASLLAVTLGAAPAYADAATVPHSYLVFFDFNKSDLTADATKIVDQAATDAAAGKATSIQVTG